MPSWIAIIIAVAAGALGNVLIKAGTQKLPAVSWNPSTLGQLLTNPYVLGGILLMVATFPFYSMVLQRMSLAVAFPLMTSAMFILATILSHFIFKDALTGMNILGIFIVILGLWLVAR